MIDRERAHGCGRCREPMVGFVRPQTWPWQAWVMGPASVVAGGFSERIVYFCSEACRDATMVEDGQARIDARATDFRSRARFPQWGSPS